MNNAYSLTVRTGKPIPRDVLVEHLAVALRDLKFLGGYYITCDKVQEEPMARQHPFDGPEMFDDEPKPASGGYVSGQERRIGHVGPAEHIFSKEEIQAMGGLDALKRLAEVLQAPVTYESPSLDAYPNVTEAAFQLREAKRNDS